MKKSATADRLQYLMRTRNLRQVDILNRVLPFCVEHGVKMNKSDISQYVSGKVSPTQDKLFVLGKALNVDPVWLMGIDVPMTRSGSETINAEITDEELHLVELFRTADPVFKQEAMEMLKRHQKDG